MKRSEISGLLNLIHLGLKAALVVYAWTVSVDVGVMMTLFIAENIALIYSFQAGKSTRDTEAAE